MVISEVYVSLGNVCMSMSSFIKSVFNCFGIESGVVHNSILVCQVMCRLWFPHLSLVTLCSLAFQYLHSAPAFASAGDHSRVLVGMFRLFPLGEIYCLSDYQLCPTSSGYFVCRSCRLVIVKGCPLSLCAPSCSVLTTRRIRMY